MASIKDVARVAGVSIATVSRYINDPSQVKTSRHKQLEAALKETGYSPNTLARNFRLGKTQLIVVVVPTIGVPLFADIMLGINRAALANGYSILVRETRFQTTPVSEISNILLSKQADGIILLGNSLPFEEAELPPGTSLPPVVISCEAIAPDLNRFPSVRVDDKAAAREATDHLIALGHRDIAFMSGIPGSHLTVDREKGYRASLRKHKIPVRPAWIVSGNLTTGGARRATRELFKQAPHPTAIFCANDEMAMGTIHEIKALGLRVPADVSVVGFDDMLYSEIYDPPITTIYQPAAEIGEKSVQRLLAIINGENTSTEADIVSHKLVVRQSTAPVAKS